MNEHILVKGAGPTGCLLSLGLSCNKYNVRLVDPKSQEEIIARNRAYALTHSTKNYLNKIGLWTQIKEIAVKFSELEVIDVLNNFNINFAYKDLLYKETSNNAVGWIVDHKKFMSIIFTEIRKHNSINFIPNFTSNSLNDKQSIIFAADGPYSETRIRQGIKSYGYKYSQSCLTFQASLKGIANAKAYEIFRMEGPMAILPIGNSKFQIVWTAASKSCYERLKLSQSEFLAKIAEIMPYGIEPEYLLTEREVFPLKLSIASRMSKHNLFLVGESAHTIHPIGGQGMNLCIRDIDKIVNLFNQRVDTAYGYNLIKINYNIIRYLDIIALALSTDLIVRIFSTDNNFFVKARKLFLPIIKKSKLLKLIILKFMTYGLSTSS